MAKICPIMSNRSDNVPTIKCIEKDCTLWVDDYLYNKNGKVIKGGYCGLCSQG